MYDLLKASDGLIGHGTGNVNVNIEFRMIVFRPFKGEIIAAVVKASTPSGIQVSTQFFEDIFVPSTMLFDGSQFDEGERTWVWKSEEADVWFDPGTVVNIRIEQEHWQDRAPGARSVNEDAVLDSQPHVPYSLTVRCSGRRRYRGLTFHRLRLLKAALEA